MLIATPRRLFSWDYAVALGNDHLADIDIARWRERGTLTIAGQRYGVYREQPLRGRFILDSNGSVLASAEKPSAFTRRLLIEHAGRRYELKPRSAISRTFYLHDGPEIMGSLAASNLLSRRMKVDLPETLPLPVRVFLMWLTVILWKRESESAAG